MQTKYARLALLGITGFAAISALGGGIGVMATNGLGMPLAWLHFTPFTSYLIPGLILAVVVGGSAFAAMLLLLLRHLWAPLVALGAGAIMVGWIVIEVFLIRQTAWLQLLYLVVGLAMMELAIMLDLQTPRTIRNLLHSHSSR